MGARSADEAIATVARDHGRSLVGYAYLLTGSLRDAEDLVQDALVKTVVRGSALDTTAVVGYVRTAILTLYIDGYRRRKRWEAVRHLVARDEHRDGPDAAASARVDVQAALRELPPQQRACVVLRFYDDLTVPQIADRLGLAGGTVKRYLSLATHRMEALLGPVAPAPADDDAPLVEGHRS